MGGISFEFRRYRRRFRAPLRTARGVWRYREGLLVRVVDREGRVGFGEAAPSPWEEEAESIDSVEAFLRKLGGTWDNQGRVATGAPRCCCYALESAVAQADRDGRAPEECFDVAALLPAGDSALEALKDRRREGYRVFKWKIGVGSDELAREIFAEMLRDEPADVSFRLDANGGFDPAEATRWVRYIEPHSQRVEFLEQPYPRAARKELFEIARRSPVPIALDESVTTLDDIREMIEGGWPGLYVVKPTWLGGWNRAAEVLRSIRARAVFSSALETSIGIENALQLAAAAGKGDFALGFGVLDLFEPDGLTIHPSGPQIHCGRVGVDECQQIWERA